MWSSDHTNIAIFITTLLLPAAAYADVSCPGTHAGKPLLTVSVHVGPIENQADIMPRDGGWDLYDPAIIDPALMTSDLRLRCRYQGTLEEVVVPLPHGTKLCEFDGFPKLRCHP